MHIDDAQITTLISSQFGVSKVQAYAAKQKIAKYLKRLPAELRDSPSAQIWVTLYAVGGDDAIKKITDDFQSIADDGHSGEGVPAFLTNLVKTFLADSDAIRSFVGG